MDEEKVLLKPPKLSIEEINKMAIFTPMFLTAEKPEVAPFKDQFFAWQLSKFHEHEPDSSSAFKSINNHSWYLDPTVIPTDVLSILKKN